jgi:hypothetical protein
MAAFRDESTALIASPHYRSWKAAVSRCYAASLSDKASENTARGRTDMADRTSGAQIMLHRNAPANAGEMQEERPWKDRHPVSVAGVHVAAQHDCLC